VWSTPLGYRAPAPCAAVRTRCDFCQSLKRVDCQKQLEYREGVAPDQSRVCRVGGDLDEVAVGIFAVD